MCPGVSGSFLFLVIAVLCKCQSHTNKVLLKHVHVICLCPSLHHSILDYQMLFWFRYIIGLYKTSRVCQLKTFCINYVNYHQLYLVIILQSKKQNKMFQTEVFFPFASLCLNERRFNKKFFF